MGRARRARAWEPARRSGRPTQSSFLRCRNRRDHNGRRRDPHAQPVLYATRLANVASNTCPIVGGGSPLSAVAEAIGSGRLPGRGWLYSNYHCNLACSYCLTESAPDVAKRRLGGERMVALAQEATELGFNEVGVTGGEPFLEPDMPEIVARLTEIVPVVVLTNGTLFTGRRLERMAPLGGADVRIQISLDSSDPVENDTMRGPITSAR